MPPSEVSPLQQMGGTHRAALVVLAASSFVYVTAETIPVGLLPQISAGLSVSEGDVGLLLTTYAAVAAVSTIPLTALTGRYPRHRLMVVMVAVFALSQLAAALAPSFAVLTASRLLCALAHGVFWSAIAPVAARLAPSDQAGRATSMVFLGNSLALVLGVPLGTAVGQLAGWRTAFAALAVGGLISTIALARVLPALPATPAERAAGIGLRLGNALRIISSRRLTAICAITTVLVIGQFAAYTYIAPLVRESAGISGIALTALLLGYGGAGVVGNLIVGRTVDSRPGPTLAGCVALIAAALVVLSVGHGTVVIVCAVIGWGAAFTSVPVSLQSAVLRVAPQAPDAASAVYVVAYQIGIGGGALLGAGFVNSGQVSVLPGLAATLAVVAAVLVLCSRSVFPWRRYPVHR